MLTNRLTGTTEATATTATNTQILRPAYPPLPATSGHNPKANLLAIPIRPRRRRPVADKQFLLPVISSDIVAEKGRASKAEDRLDHVRGSHRLGDIVHAKNPCSAKRTCSGGSDGGRQPICLGQASRLADEVLVRDGCEQRQTDVRDLSQPAGEFQGVQSVLVEVMPGIDDDLVLRHTCV